MPSPSRAEPPLRLAAGVDLDEHVRGWVYAPELAELVVAFGGTAPDPDGDLDEALAALDALSDRWDTRGGRERNEAAGSELSDEQVAAIGRAARALGQEDERLPAHTSWDHVVILGGLLRACIARPAFTAGILASGRITAASVVALGAFRALNDPERELGRDVIGAVPADEIDAMELGVRRAFGLDGVFSVVGEQAGAPELSWEERTYADPSPGPAFRVIAAAAPRPGRRATTPQALRWFGERHELAPGTSLLIVTTEIYRHYHLVDAIRTVGIPYGLTVDCIGMSPGAVDERLAHTFRPQSRVQEIRSSIRALRALRAAART